MSGNSGQCLYFPLDAYCMYPIGKAQVYLNGFWSILQELIDSQPIFVSSLLRDFLKET